MNIQSQLAYSMQTTLSEANASLCERNLILRPTLVVNSRLLARAQLLRPFHADFQIYTQGSYGTAAAKLDLEWH